MRACYTVFTYALSRCLGNWFLAYTEPDWNWSISGWNFIVYTFQREMYRRMRSGFEWVRHIEHKMTSGSEDSPNRILCPKRQLLLGDRIGGCVCTYSSIAQNMCCMVALLPLCCVGIIAGCFFVIIFPLSVCDHNNALTMACKIPALSVQLWFKSSFNPLRKHTLFWT